jgi:NAD(P)H-hydrate epimerase
MLLSREQARALDQWAMADLGIPGVVLMENAGRGIAELLATLGIQGTVLIACGPGNNGGDGFVIARHLDNLGHPVRVLLFAHPDQLRGDAAINYQILVRSGFPVESLPDVEEAWLQNQLQQVDWVVDALFGTGLKSALRSPFDRIVNAINTCPRRVMAVDLPSGLDCDTGIPLGPTIRAHHTATVVAAKLGFQAASAREWIGEVRVIDMGVPRRALGQFPLTSARTFLRVT